MTESLVEMLQRGESRQRGYDDYNRYAPRPGGPGHFRGADREIDFSEMTVADIRQNQQLPWDDADKLHAVGRYQIIGPTLQGAIEDMGLNPSDRFTPALQDRILVENLMVSKRPDIHDYITGKPGVTLRDAQVAMANEWASVGHPDYAGGSKYPNNHASITLAQSSETLSHARSQYAAAIADGESPQEAWRSAAGLGLQPDRVQGGAQQADEKPKQTAAMSDGVLKFGERGPDIEGLQRSLNQLGVRDANGKPLKPDGDFGIHTREAVTAFQTANGLRVDGLAGRETLEAIGRKLPEGKVTVERAEVTGEAPQQPAARTPLISDSAHPNNALYTAIGGQLPAGTKPEVTANVTMQAMENGITSPDKLKGVVVKDGDAFVVGNNPGDRVKVDLSAPTPDLQQMSTHMQAETTQSQQQRAQPDPQVTQAR